MTTKKEKEKIKRVLIVVDLEEFDSLDYVGKADWLIGKVEVARIKPRELKIK